jgi:hypothetical protein
MESLRIWRVEFSAMIWDTPRRLCIVKYITGCNCTVLLRTNLKLPQLVLISKSRLWSTSNILLQGREVNAARLPA